MAVPDPSVLANVARASDPRLPPQAQQIEAPPQPQQTQEVMAMPEMPQMPQMPPQAPLQPSYNTKEDGYVLRANDEVVVWTRIYSAVLSSYRTLIDSRSTHLLDSPNKLVSTQLGYFITSQTEIITSYSTLCHLGQVLAKRQTVQYIPFLETTLFIVKLLDFGSMLIYFIVKCSLVA